jgi:UDP-2,3-diacylglucosamine pyrophosphatase LpxH
MTLPQFDEIHIVSDLHMGGLDGFQILRETGRLAGFIRWVAGQQMAGRVALVLNGDVIDTLAEESGGYIAVDNAETIVQRIIGDPSFAPVWEALADFVKTADRTLIIVLGNHDIELSFPVVQRTIIGRLAGDDLVARARIEFSCMGAGYSCVVGGSRVFCTHGNEVDAWNYIRYEDLARAARRLNAGRSLDPGEWQPNAGTKLVKDVMNDVKHHYPWIDLLKPEIKAAVGVLLALDPGQLAKVNRLLPIIGEKVEGSMEVDQRLSSDGISPPSGRHPRPATIDSLLGPSLTEGLRHGSGGSMSAAADPYDETLGTGQYIWDRLTGWFIGISQAEALRRALVDWLKDDRTFDIDHRDDTFKDVVTSVGPGVHFIVTGHTHLERAIDLGNGRFYFNCGTWIRLLRFTEKMLKDEDSFKPVYDLLVKSSMAAIDKFPNDVPFVLDQSSAVCIKTEGNKVIGQLVHIKGNGEQIEPASEQFTR